METYSVRELNGKDCVIHYPSGCSIPYHSKVSAYTAEEIKNQNYKLEHFNDWFSYSNQKRKKIKHMSMNGCCANVPTPQTWGKFQVTTNTIEDCAAMYIPSVCSNYNVNSLVSFDIETTASTLPWKCPSKKSKPTMPVQEKESAMFGPYDNETPTDQQQRAYVIARLQNIESEKTQEARKAFGLTDDDSPQSFNDLLARLTLGKYVYPEDKKAKDVGGSYGILDYIRWRDPAVKEDEAGYDASRKQISAAYKDAKDAAVLANLDQLKTVLDSFKSQTFH